MTSKTSPRSRAFVQAVVGAPFVPPGFLTRWILALRAMVASLHRRMAPPAVRILEGLFGLFDNRALGLLVALDVPDKLERPMEASELARLTDTDAQAMERLLNFAHTRGFLGRDRRGRFLRNEVTKTLMRDVLGSWRGWVEFASAPWFWQIWQSLDLKRDATPAAQKAHGTSFFEYVKENRSAGRAFDRAMAAGGQLQGLALAHALSWKNISSICDVGGGTGATLEVLLRYHEQLCGELFDLPEVVADCALEGALSERCAVTGGDFFESVPSGHDRYLLLAVLHDWDDEHAIQILTKVRETMKPGARIFVVESVLGERRDGFVEATDLMMMTLAVGRERTRQEFEQVFQAAGLRGVAGVRLATGTFAFELSK